jgi:hypothetical protein
MNKFSNAAKQKYPALRDIHWPGGELGIRTPGTFNSSTVFKTAAIDHSANSPGAKVQNRAELPNLAV